MTDQMDHPPIAQRTALCSRSSPRSLAEGAPFLTKLLLV
jgi:hypothetical protein